MPLDTLPRKLAAIFYADVAGYSRLTGQDEDATHRALSSSLDLVSETISENDGRVVHYAGDAVLADFDSVSSAVACAVSIQRDLGDQNRELPDERRVQFRIGINLGEVIVDRDDIYGDGVNVAARLETLADAGGVCVSEAVRNAVGNRLPVHFDFMGEQTVKNIAEPIRAYSVQWETEPESPTVATAGSAPHLPDAPSIAVLPFVNMSADSEQEFFADGITEDLITALSKVSGLFVIARNSAFTYKGKAVEISEVGKQLGVRYILEGSVRKAANRVRITAQLLDSTDGHHLWAERYDRDLTDVFALQDEITAKVVTALQVQLVEGEQARLWEKSTSNVEAWTAFTQGLVHFRRFTREDNAKGRRLFEQAVELDPEYATAWVWLGWTYWSEVRFLWTESPKETLKMAGEFAHKAVAMDANLSEAHALLSAFHLMQHDYDEATSEGEKAVALDPNGADVTALLAMTFNWSERPKEAIRLINKAMRLSPLYSAWYLAVLAHAQRLLGQYDEAIDSYRASLSRNPNHIGPLIGLTATYSEVGRLEEAKAKAAELLELYPNFSLKQYSMALTYRDSARAAAVLDALRAAGLPD